MAAATFTRLLDTPQPVTVIGERGQVHVEPYMAIVGGAEKLPERLARKIYNASMRPAWGRDIATRLVFTYGELPPDFRDRGHVAYASLGNLGESGDRLAAAIGEQQVTVSQPNMAADAVSQSVVTSMEKIAPRHLLDRVAANTVTGVFPANVGRRLESGIPLYAMPGSTTYREANLLVRQDVAAVDLAVGVLTAPLRAITRGRTGNRLQGS